MKQEILNKKTPTFHELIKAASEAKTKEDAIEVFKNAMKEDRERITFLLGYAMNPASKCPLPDGVPPYKVSESPAGLAPLELLMLAKKMYPLWDNNVRQAKREELYIQWMEQLCQEEAELFIAIKDQTLHTLYPMLDENTLVSILGWPMEKYQEMLTKFPRKKA